MRPIELTLSCSYTTATEPTRRVCEVASMFGLGVDRERTIAVVPQVTLPITPASIVFITGASGGGKSTLLRLIGEQLRQRTDVRVVEFGGGRKTHPGQGEYAMTGLGEQRSIVEAIGGTLEQAVRWLSLAGLNDAFVMLRKVSELSDGQRYRFALACAMAEAAPGSEEAGAMNCPRREEENLTVVLADEFGSTLDRMTAKVVARNVRKWVARSAVRDAGCAVRDGECGVRDAECGMRDAECGMRDAECGVRDAGCGVRDAGCGVRDADPQAAPRKPHNPSGGAVCFIAATAHDDLLEALEPDVLVVQEPGEGIAVHLRERNAGCAVRDAENARAASRKPHGAQRIPDVDI